MANEKRLIYAEDLVKTIVNTPSEVANMYTYNVLNSLVDRTNEILDMIDNAPSVDAAPVVHGRWVAVPSSDMMTGKAYKCSECGKMRYGSFVPNFCQNCGAKMDGGEYDG
jgi:hypothetical protein